MLSVNLFSNYRAMSSIEVYDWQFKIDEKLNRIQKRKNNPNETSAKIKEHPKMFKKMTWIKRSILQIRKRYKNVKLVGPPLQSRDILDVINRIMVLQKSLIELANNIGNYRRIQMLCIFFQCSLSIVFNAYNLVVFLLKLANKTGDVPLSPFMLLFFYGYHIMSSLGSIILSVLAYSGVFHSIRQTASKMDELNMYILDSDINSRISQLSNYVFNNLRTFTVFGLYNIDGSLVTSILAGTTTYIIILIQYSGDGEICKTPEYLQTNDTQNLAK